MTPIPGAFYLNEGLLLDLKDPHDLAIFERQGPHLVQVPPEHLVHEGRLLDLEHSAEDRAIFEEAQVARDFEADAAFREGPAPAAVPTPLPPLDEGELKSVTIRLPEALVDAYKARARDRKTKYQRLMKEALSAYLEDST